VTGLVAVVYFFLTFAAVAEAVFLSYGIVYAVRSPSSAQRIDLFSLKSTNMGRMVGAIDD
jgi:hypothetical protein